MVLPILCLGKFDALHRGHRALVEAARGLGEPHVLRLEGVAAVLGRETPPALLDDGDRAAVLADWQVHERSIDFAGIRNLSPEAFVAYCRSELAVGGLVCGEDFRFGRDRLGDAATLRRLGEAAGLRVAVVPALHEDGEVVSSTRIRAALADGNVELVRALLGRPYRLSGTVVQGDARGRQLGFPTANLGQVGTQLPRFGVYVAHARFDDSAEELVAAVNVGRLPTVGVDTARVEAHLLDWSADCYGRGLSLDLREFRRSEQRFDGLDALRSAIAADVAAARRLLDPSTQSA